MDQAAFLPLLNPLGFQYMHHDLQTLLEKLNKFRDERDWTWFKSPKNLAVSIGAAELEKGEK
jgi:hypothetical protein